MRGIGKIGFVIFLVAGLYYINKFANVVPLSLSAGTENIIFLVTGILLILGGFFAMRANRF